MAKNQLWIVLGIAGVIAVFVAWKGWGGAASAVAGAAVSATGGAIAGTAEGLGAQVGIPLTDPQKCEAYIAAGNTMSASMYCTAGRFLDYLGTGK